MEGRLQATRIFIDYPKKHQFSLIHLRSVLFQLCAECVWLFKQHFHVEELDKGKSRVTFRNGSSIIVHVSKHVMLKL